MSEAPSVSLVIVNSGRRAELALALKSLRYQRYANFEVIVVTDAAERDRPDSPVPVRWLRFAERNISAARNLGVAAARGEIIAFCDDDAVPEFGWLSALVAPFADLEVGAAGGFVRGRNGVSFQWRAVEVDRLGRDRRLRHGPETAIHRGNGERFVKTVGTNCAFRRAALAEVGGFDEAYRFFLDETDLNLRLAERGWATAVVPRAEVHHGFAASDLRTSGRVPRSLFEIGASLAYFLSRHAPVGDRPARLAEFTAEQRGRLDRHYLLGQLDAGRMHALLVELHEGYREGAARAPCLPAPLAVPEGPFTPVPRLASGRRRLFLGGVGGQRGAAAAASAAAAAGDEVTLIHAEPSHRPLTVQFTDDGYFRHRFGLLGKSERGERRRIRSPGERFAVETSRILSQRGAFLP